MREFNIFFNPCAYFQMLWNKYAERHTVFAAPLLNVNAQRLCWNKDELDILVSEQAHYRHPQAVIAPLF